MNFARITVLAIAVLTAALAAYLVRGLSSSKGPAEAAQVQQVAIPTQRILVSKRTISVGETLSADDLTWQEWPEAALTPAYVVAAKGSSNASKWIGKTVRADIMQGEPILRVKVVDIGDSGFMAAVLDPGMRAISIKISAQTGAGGFILPNDRVDVMITRKVEGAGGRMFKTDTILEDVRVLAIDQTFHEGQEQKVVVGKTATLELSPQNAERISLAQAMGDISLSLRSLAKAENEKPRNDLADASRSGIKVVRFGTSTNVFVGGQ